MKLQVTHLSIQMEIPKKVWISFLLMNMHQKHITWHNIGGLCPEGSCILEGTYKIRHARELGVRILLVCLPPFKMLTNELGIIN